MRENAIINTVFLAAFLGGATHPWSQGIILVVIGLSVLAFPPKIRPPRALVIFAVGAFVLALSGFLPATFFSKPSWRIALEQAGASLPSTLSPQPWLTLEAIVPLAAALLWLCWLAGHDWTAQDRVRLIRGCGVACSLLAALVLLFYFIPSARLPFWFGARGFGPFPNLNQTANLLALGAIMTLACAERERCRQRPVWRWWAGAFLLLFCTVILSGSRAGIAVLLGGAALWLLVIGGTTRSARRIAIGVAALAVLLSLFFVLGEATLRRFQTGILSGNAPPLGFRSLVFADALDLLKQGPWCGLGLGNFKAVFPFFRDVSLCDFTLLHPESDWLWLGSEMGWAGLIWIALGAGWLLSRAFPFPPGTERGLRAAALAAGIVFLGHGFVDVSAHRLGSVLPPLLLATLSMSPRAGEIPGAVSKGLFRIGGFLIMLCGLIWVLGPWGPWPLPGSLGAQKMRLEIEHLKGERRWREVAEASQRAISWTPLESDLYFTHATAAASEGDFLQALKDFRVARALEPIFPRVALAEGQVWLAIQPQLAFPAWEDALQRPPAARSARTFAAILAIAPKDPLFQAQLRELAKDHLRLQLVYLQQADERNARAILETILSDVPDLKRLTSEERSTLFVSWARFGDLAALDRKVAEEPSFMKEAWPILARRAAERGDFSQACRLALENLPRPTLPTLPRVNVPLTELRRRALLDRTDLTSAYALYQAELKNDDPVAARHALAAAAQSQDAPDYLRYLHASLLVEAGAWPEAWSSLKRLVDSPH